MDQTLGGRQAKRALKTAFIILDSASDAPEEIYTHIYKAVICFINHKTGSNKVEYSTGEITEIIKNFSEAEVYNRIEQILKHVKSVDILKHMKSVEIDIELMHSDLGSTLRDEQSTPNWPN